MSYAGHANLITLQLADSSAQVDSRLTRMLATSLVVHAVLLLGLMSVRFAPTLQQPLASYHVDLVTLPEPRVASPSKKPATVKKATVVPPPEPQVIRPVPSPVVQKTPPAPIQTERVTQSIVDAVESVVVPQSRKMAPIVNASAMTQLPVQAVRKDDASQAILLPIVPQAPQLSTRKTLPDRVAPAPSTPSPSSLAETLRQAVQSVAIPQKTQTPMAQIPSPVTPKAEPISPKSQSTAVTSPKITIPGQVPQMAKVIPVPKPTEIQPKSRPQNLMTDSVKHILQSVVVPEVRKSKVPPTKKMQAVSVPTPPVLDRQPITRKELDGIVIPSDAPKLASLDLTKSMPKKSAVVPPETVPPNVLDQKIAKLIIPEVQVPEVHYILSKPTDSGMQNTTTALQISGSSPEGNAYWGRVWSKIDREWIAPQVDVRSGSPLRVILAFRIERQGGVRNLAIEQSSGNEYYDLAAKRAVLDATPLPPFASDMPEPFYDIQFQFTVNLDS
jgi:TonB family protein